MNRLYNISLIIWLFIVSGFITWNIRAHAAIWVTEEIEETVGFDDFYSRAVATDGNRIHLVYGGKHLYYTYSNDGSNWEAPVTVDPAQGVGRYAAIAVDSSGYAHISYYDGILSDLMYATNLTGNWVIECVDSAGDVGRYTSIALDSNDRVHISYYDSSNSKIRYATNISGTWNIENNIDSNSGVGRYTSIAIDSSDNAYISYFDASNKDLLLVYQDAGLWARIVVDNTNDVGEYTSIAVDGSDNLHISYFDRTNNYLKYAHGAPGALTIETVDNSGEAGTYTSITIDDADKVYISYHAWHLEEIDPDRGTGSYTAHLRYAENSSGSWDTHNVESEEHAMDLGKYTSIAVAGTGLTLQISIAYLGAEDNLKYADYSPLPFPIWRKHSIVENQIVGKCTSIALDSSDNAHISYCDETNRNLKYATNAAGAWEHERIGNIGALIESTSIAVDSSDKAHISYFGESEVLKYASHYPDYQWTVETVDLSTTVGRYSSLALDANNHAHIAYWNEDDDHLWYATNAPSGEWSKDIIDSGCVGKHPSIALDSTSNVHVSYLYEYFGHVPHLSQKHLLYATNSSGVWISKEIDNTGFVGEYTSIVLDSSDKAHIAYFDLTNSDLKYATNTSDQWDIETIDSDGYVGMYTSMALDSEDKLHIIYCGWTTEFATSFLKYANKTQGNWVIETINSGGNAGKYSSIAIDSSDKIHISYFDEGKNTLMYSKSP